MDIKLRKVKVRELTEGYIDDPDKGVIGLGGKLNIRPPYQREFIYNEKQREAVIVTIERNYPLNVMYWADNGDGTYEVIDGQQRTISICQYVTKEFSHDFRFFHNLTQGEQDEILDYELMVYVCSGTDKEKLDWFQTINIAGEKLTQQELLNALFSGSWVTSAKKYFSKPKCVAFNLGNKYLTGSANRSDYLATAIKWISNNQVENYMAQHQHDPNATALWIYFQSVITWVKEVFPKYRKEMKGVDWGWIYNKYHNNIYNAEELERVVSKCMMDSDVDNKKGIYKYVFDNDVKHLDIRAFDENTKREVYERQQGICKICGKHFDIEFMEADHITPWVEGGRTVAENCQMLCRECNRRKSSK